jgi:hypothetical protein
MLNGKNLEEKNEKTCTCLILLDFAFFAKALSNRIKAGLLAYSIPYAFPSIDSGMFVRNCFRAYSCATVRDFHTVPF